MNPGRELDALVAEKVMGRPININSYKADYLHLLELGRISCTYEEFLDMQDIWSPSTDIAAAWEVVEKMQIVWDFMMEKDSSTEGQFHCFFGKHKGEAFSAPHAICLAALKAVEAV